MKSIPHLNPSTDSRLHSEFSERLVTLCDGRSGLRSGLQVDIREPSPAVKSPPADNEHATSSSATLDFIASDETLDRADEIIAATGWRLESYRRNPVFQNAHQYGDVIFTLGKAILTEVRLVSGRPALFQRVQFAVDANPMARITYGLYKGKFLNAVSVGFIPLLWQDNPSSSSSSSSFSSSSSAAQSDEGGLVRRRYLEQELLEVSAVGIPANPNALQLGLKAGVIQKSDLQELLDLLRGLMSDPNSPALHHSISPLSPSHPAVPDTHARASGVRSYEAQLLRLAREIKEMIHQH
jgi:hypothetical protein